MAIHGGWLAHPLAWISPSITTKQTLLFYYSVS